MSPSRWTEVDTILGEALQLPAEERGAFLASRCGTDGELRTEVESLLKLEAAANSFLDVSTRLTGDQSVASREERRPDWAGAYRIHEEVGRGGMGVVYRAERDDGQFRKRVAVKVLDSGAASEASWQRFQEERQIMASLEHPNICRLMDAGVLEHGVPYLVMEFVQGRNVVEHCRGLEERAKIRLFLKICSAVQYAHQNLVVHRDIKPGNILVSENGEPKLMDFGIAKMLAPAAGGQQTQVMLRALTPDYASPEQIRGAAVTTQSDLYSLGVVLYEVLTGDRPYRTAGKPLDEVLGMAGKAPSGLLSPDLLAIVRKAMRVEPEKRYATPSELAADLDRYLAGHPVQARKGNRWYVLRKFAVRRKWVLAGSGMAAATILSLAGTAWWQARLAQRRFEDVQRLANSVLYEIHNAIAPLPGSTPARKLLAQRSLEYLDRLSVDASGDAKLLANVAEGYMQLGRILGGSGESNLGDPEGAISAMRKAGALLERARQEGGNPAALQEREIARLTTMARLLPQREAVSMLQEAIASGEQLAARTKMATHGNDLANAYLGYADRMDPQSAEKLEYLGRAIKIYDALAAAEPGNWNYQRNGALARKRLGSAYCLVGRGAECIEQLEAALRIDEERHKKRPADDTTTVDLAISMAELALRLHHRGGETDRVLDLSRRSVKLRRAAWDRDPKNARFAGRLVYAYLTLSFYHEKAQQPGEALQAAKEAAAVVEQTGGRLDAPGEAVRTYTTIGNLLEQAGQSGCAQYATAKRYYNEIAKKGQPPKELSRLIEKTERCRAKGART